MDLELCFRVLFYAQNLIPCEDLLAGILFAAVTVLVVVVCYDMDADILVDIPIHVSEAEESVEHLQERLQLPLTRSLLDNDALDISRQLVLCDAGHLSFAECILDELLVSVAETFAGLRTSALAVKFICKESFEDRCHGLGCLFLGIVMVVQKVDQILFFISLNRLSTFQVVLDVGFPPP